MTDKIPFAVDKSEFLDGTWVSSTWLEPILHLNGIFCKFDINNNKS